MASIFKSPRKQVNAKSWRAAQTQTGEESSSELKGEPDSESETESENFNNDGSPESDLEEDDGSEEDTAARSQRMTQFREYDSVGPGGSDEEDVGLTVSEGDDEDDDAELASRLADDYPSLMQFLHDSGSESASDEHDGGSDSDLEIDQADFDDDSSIEEEEEQAIVDEMDVGSTVSGDDRDPDLEEEDSDGLSSDDLLDDDFLGTPNSRWNRPRNSVHSSPKPRQTAADEDDDSYLWAYFFSTDDEGDGQDDLNSSFSKSSRTNGGAQDHTYVDDRRHFPGNQDTESYAQQHSGDSTDEEDNLPLPSKRAQGSRAVEVLSADSFNTRPPVLGSWDLKNSKGNVGIIDGLTTRTLSPPPEPQTPLRDTPLDEDENENDISMWLDSDVEVSDVALDEFINTDELGEDDEESDLVNADASAKDNVSPFIYRNRFSNKVPLFAFRNRSSPYTQASYEPAARKLRRRSHGANREDVMSSVRSIRRKSRKMRSLQHKRDRERDMEFANKDLLEELVRAGAITPLFEI